MVVAARLRVLTHARYQFCMRSGCMTRWEAEKRGAGSCPSCRSRVLGKDESSGTVPARRMPAPAKAGAAAGGSGAGGSAGASRLRLLRQTPRGFNDDIIPAYSGGAQLSDAVPAGPRGGTARLWLGAAFWRDPAAPISVLMALHSDGAMTRLALTGAPWPLSAGLAGAALAAVAPDLLLVCGGMFPGVQCTACPMLALRISWARDGGGTAEVIPVPVLRGADAAAGRGKKAVRAAPPPQRRSSAAAAAHGGVFYLLGGMGDECGEATRGFWDLHAFTLADPARPAAGGSWTALRLRGAHPPSGGYGPALWGAAQVQRGSTLYLIGGRTHSGYSAEVYAVDLPRGAVRCLAPAPGGTVPRGRLGAAAVQLRDGRLLLAGGGDAQVDTRDAFTFDLGTHAWRRVELVQPAAMQQVLRESLIAAAVPDFAGDDAARDAAATQLLVWGGSACADAAAGSKSALGWSPRAKLLVLEPAQ